MILLIDTREKHPLEYKPDGKIINEVKSRTLNVGDYGAIKDGIECPIYFERKYVGDLLGTITREHARFKREIQRAKDNNMSIIIAIEGTLTDIYSGVKYSKISGKAVVKAIITMYHKYGVPHIFFKNRSEMMDYIKFFYDSYFRNYNYIINERK